MKASDSSAELALHLFIPGQSWFLESPASRQLQPYLGGVVRKHCTEICLEPSSSHQRLAIEIALHLRSSRQNGSLLDQNADKTGVSSSESKGNPSDTLWPESATGFSPFSR